MLHRKNAAEFLRFPCIIGNTHSNNQTFLGERYMDIGKLRDMYAKYRGLYLNLFASVSILGLFLYFIIYWAQSKTLNGSMKPLKEVFTSTDIEIVVGTAFVAAVFNAVLKRLTSGIDKPQAEPQSYQTPVITMATLPVHTAQDIAPNAEPEVQGKPKLTEDELAIERCRQIFKDNELRLSRQRANSGFVGNVNLAIGITITFACGAVLIYMALHPHQEDHLVGLQLLKEDGPRFSIVAFGELVAFFFLRLYRDSPQEEKYYLNELTALSSRRIALECAHAFKHTIVLQKVVESLVTMDPNAGRALRQSNLRAQRCKRHAGEHRKSGWHCNRQGE